MSSSESTNFVSETLKKREANRQWYRNHREFKKNWASEYVKKSRQKAIDLLGGQCQVCSDVESLQFHHLYYEENDNRFNIWRDVLKKPQKYMLVCFTCHKLIGLQRKYPKKFRLFMEKMV